MLNEVFPKIVLALDTSIKAKWTLLAATLALVPLLHVLAFIITKSRRSK
jgi:hypothetical protein